MNNGIEKEERVKRPEPEAIGAGVTNLPMKPCPLCTDDDYASMGGMLFDTPEEAAEAWNARWERVCHDDGRGVFRCDACGAFVRRDAVMDCIDAIPIRYCPNCGAKVVAQ